MPESTEPLQSAEFVVASFNVHAAVDGYGRPWDVVAACSLVDADVLVLQEVWCPPGGSSTAEVVASALGYEVADVVALSWGRLLEPAQSPPADWGPTLRTPFVRRALRLEHWHPRRPEPDQVPGDGAGSPSEEEGRAQQGAARRHCGHGVQGQWGLAVLSRLPISGVERLDLGKLRRDRARRVALAVEVELRQASETSKVTVVGVHMSHLSHGSPAQFRRLRALLPAAHVPCAVAGDMNLWGPPVVGLLPGWKRAVRGRTWTAWRPVAQLDHIVVSPALEVVCGEVVEEARGSDHLPVRARLALSGNGSGPGRRASVGAGNSLSAAPSNGIGGTGGAG